MSEPGVSFESPFMHQCGFLLASITPCVSLEIVITGDDELVSNEDEHFGVPYFIPAYVDQAIAIVIDRRTARHVVRNPRSSNLSRIVGRADLFVGRGYSDAERDPD
jgi:hypothetical protein